ncbi:MAG: glycosyltransferase family 2 protein [Spirulina sp.]
MNPVVSVIIPAYNTEAYIEKAIRSVLDQTWQNFEVVVVDDGSTDKTVSVVRSITDNRVKLFKNDHNMGAGASRNRAIRESHGDWVAVLDSDDWYAPGRLERLVNLAQAQGADMVADDLYIVEDGHNQPRTTLLAWGGTTCTQPIYVRPVDFVKSDVESQRGLKLGFSKPIFKRQFLCDHSVAYRPEIIVSQDFWIALDCLVNGANFWLLPKPYYYYRCREGALTSSTKITLRLDQECEAITRFMAEHQSYLASHPNLAKALAFKLRETAKYRDYYSVVEPLKGKKYAQALGQVSAYPGFIAVLFQRFPGILSRRIQALFHKDNVYYKFN